MNEQMKTSSTISDFGLSDVSIDRNKTYSRRECYMSLIVATIVSFVVGVLLGNVALTKPNVEQLRTKTEQLEYFERFVRINEVDVTEQLLDDVSATRIGEFLKNMTRRPTMAGTQSNRLEGEEIKKTWMDHGLPDVKLNPYDVLLAYPDPEKPSSVSILNESGDILFQTKASRVTEADVDLGRKPVPSFNAYSAAGNIKADLVYVNYGLPDDFTLLKKQGIDVEGKILLIRYGKMGRSSKVLFAEQQGAAGVILYSDPMDFSVKGAKGVYPESVNLPPDGVQSGSIKKMASDPLTPGYPATESAYRLDIEHVKGESGVPRIPVYPIGYGDAQELLKRLDGPEAPEQWKGGLEVVYKIGPGLMNNSIVRLEVNDELKRKVITNVIGTIPGSIEPDRYVIIGNHRDSWTNGACDPKSGTACLMELTRVFGQLYMQGWRPRRTIIFCSWDAEEYGYVGSTEWIEENRFIMDRAVVYLNVDQAVTGNRVFYARSVPGLFNIIHEITKMVPNPNEDEVRRGRVSVYDTWSILQSNESDYIPWIPVLNGGSDFYPFTHDYGIASADFRFRGYKLSSPLYHSKYELFDLQEKLLDKTFTYHRAVTQVWALLAITFSEPVLLPFNTAEYGATLKHNYEKLRSFYGELMKKHKLNLEYLETAVEAFAETTERFESIKSRLVTNDPFEIRRINDQMLRVGRSMISIEYQENYLRRSMNVFYGRSPTNRDGLLFGPLVIELDNLKQSPGSRLLDESVKKQISVLVYHLQSATLVLKNITR